MALGPGKYDDECTMVRRAVGIGPHSGGGVIVIVMGGNRGNGFSCQTDLETLRTLPEMLESVARQMREGREGVLQFPDVRPVDADPHGPA